jgi:hypothetical protein
MAHFDASLSHIAASSSDRMPPEAGGGVMTRRWLGSAGALLLLPMQVTTSTCGVRADRPQTEVGPYARIAVLRPHDGETVEFEAGYIRHLEFHRQAKDSWTWYGWTVWAGDRQRWFVYATFGHSAASLNNPVPPAEDERDNVANVTPHAQFVGNAIYEYLPGLSRGTAVPTPAARLEFTTVDLEPGAEKAFETAVSAVQSTLQGETLWFRMIAGGSAPRYVRLRPRPSLTAILDAKNEQPLSDAVNRLVGKMTIEILNLRPTMSYRLRQASGGQPGLVPARQ